VDEISSLYIDIYGIYDSNVKFKYSYIVPL